MHEDSPIGFRALMRTSKVELSKEDSWAMANLLSLSLSNGRSGISIAQAVMDIFSGHSLLRHLTRFSLVRRLGCSNRLMVMSSANKGGALNTMQEGYSCFVSGQGSLFSLKPGVARFFSSAVDVVDRYVGQGLPPQRSIARIAKMGQGAGITTGVFDNDKVVGFVFLNGDLTRADFDQDSTGVLLTHLYQILGFKFAEFRLSRLYYRLYDALPADYVGERFNGDKLADIIRRYTSVITGETMDVSTEMTAKTPVFLASHGNIGQMIARTLTALQNVSPVRVEICVTGELVQLAVSISTARTGALTIIENGHIDDIRSDARGLGMDLQVKNNGLFSLSFLVDVASNDEAIGYSVE